MEATHVLIMGIQHNAVTAKDKVGCERQDGPTRAGPTGERSDDELVFRENNLMDKVIHRIDVAP